MAAKVAFSVGSNHSALTTPAFRLSHTIALVTPPKKRALAPDLRSSPAASGWSWRRRRSDWRRPAPRQKSAPVDDAGRRIDHRHCLPGIVRLHHRARRTPIAECRARPAFESGEVLAEPDVAVAVGMGGAILLPQQRQRHPLALQLPGDQRKVRFAQVLRRTTGTAGNSSRSRVASSWPGGSG